ncbi:MAG TPA: TIGR02757 family protein, partial [Syntrophorhabdaceae bacterium]|nr:TIGR02757 family protein [Syntrophorhabdaceae bacterium]
PVAFVNDGDFRRLNGCYYRFQKDSDIIMLFQALRVIYSRFGSLGKMFEKTYSGDIRQSVWNLREQLFSDERLTFFFPKRSAASPLKRWHLYLRWMVRKDALDAGLWTFIDKKDLIVPLDTHIFKIGRCLGWTKHTTPSYKAAQDITNMLKTYSDDDPLKYDFFLCHKIGIEGKCNGAGSKNCRGKCLIYEV